MNKILVYRGMADDELDNSSKVIIGKYKGESFVDASLRSDIVGDSWSGILSIGTPSEALLKIAKAQRIPLFCTGTVQTNEDIILSAGIKYYRWWISATDQTYLVARRMIGEIHRMYTSGNNDENEITVYIAIGRVFHAEGTENVKPLNGKQAWSFQVTGRISAYLE